MRFARASCSTRSRALSVAADMCAPHACVRRAAADEVLHADHLPDTPESYRFYQNTNYGIDPLHKPLNPLRKP